MPARRRLVLRAGERGRAARPRRRPGGERRRGHRRGGGDPRRRAVPARVRLGRGELRGAARRGRAGRGDRRGGRSRRPAPRRRVGARVPGARGEHGHARRGARPGRGRRGVARGPGDDDPRLFERLRLPDPARPLVVVDAGRTGTAALADTFLELPPDRDLEALSTLRAGVRGMTIARADDLAPFDDLAARLPAFGHVALLHRVRGLAEALALHALVRDLASVTHAVSVTLRREGNAAGAEDVLAWQTGYPSAVSFAGGAPRANPGEWSAAAVLERGDADAALVVGSDPLDHLPPAAAERLRAIQVVTIDAAATATANAARVAFTTSAAGVPRAGVAHRLDGVPVALRAVLESSRPGVEDVLAAIAERLA